MGKRGERHRSQAIDFCQFLSNNQTITWVWVISRWKNPSEKSPWKTFSSDSHLLFSSSWKNLKSFNRNSTCQWSYCESQSKGGSSGQATFAWWQHQAFLSGDQPRSRLSVFRKWKLESWNTESLVSHVVCKYIVYNMHIIYELKDTKKSTFVKPHLWAILQFESTRFMTVEISEFGPKIQFSHPLQAEKPFFQLLKPACRRSRDSVSDVSLGESQSSSASRCG